MSYLDSDTTDWDFLFAEFEWLIGNGMHVTQAAAHFGYREPAALGRAYYRHGRTLPRKLADEVAWRHARQVAR